MRLRFRRSFRTGLLAALLAAVLVHAHASAAPLTPASAQSCTATPLALGATASPAATTVYQVTQSSAVWSACAVRATTGGDYDLELYAGFDGASCTPLTSLATSGTSGPRVDLIAGDFHHLASGSFYPRAVRFSGTSASVTWSQGLGVIVPDSPAFTRSIAPGQLLEIWEVALVAGVPYAFQFDRSGADLRMLLFGSPMSGSYWGGRNRALFDVTGCATFTPTASGTYALIVVNDDGASGTYRLGVNDTGCGCPPALGSGPTTVSAPSAYRLDMTAHPQWFVASVRGTAGSEWNLSVGADAVSGGCVGGVIAQSTENGVVDLVAGDLANVSSSPPVFYAGLTRTSFGSASAEFDWTGATLPVGGTISDVTGAGVVELYGVDLVAGTSYQFGFTRAGGADTHALLFANGGGTTFRSRAQRALEVPANGIAEYVAPMTGHYALAVVNDNGQGGSYTLSLTACTAPPSMDADSTVALSGATTWYVAPRAGAPFVAAAVRSLDGSVKLTAYPGGPTACPGVAQKVTQDVQGHVALVIGEAGAAGPQFRPEFGVGATGVFESDGCAKRLPVNGCAATGDGSHAMRMWIVRMEAGGSYQFLLSGSGAATFRMALFDPLAQPGVALDRFGALSESPSNIAYPATGTRDYALVLMNDNGAAGNFTLQFKGCTAPVAVPPDTAFPIADSLTAKSFLEIDPAGTGWGAVAVRGGGWTTSMFSSATGGVTGDCYGGPVGSTTTAGNRVEVLAGRFGAGALAVQPFFPMAVRTVACDAVRPDSIEWSPPVPLPMASWAERSGSGSNLVDSWTAMLDGGRAYGIVFEHRDSAANLKLLVFSPQTKPGTQWQTRSDAVIETSHSVDLLVPGSAAAQPWGLMVVNDTYQPGTYLLGVYLGGAAVDPHGPQLRTELRGMFPNPVRDRMQLEYALATRAQVNIELIDLAGRRVAVLDEGTREAGDWHLQWRPTGAGLHPGIYLLRFSVDGRTLVRRKITLLQ